MKSKLFFRPQERLLVLQGQKDIFAKTMTFIAGCALFVFLIYRPNLVLAQDDRAGPFQENRQQNVLRLQPFAEEQEIEQDRPGGLQPSELPQKAVSPPEDSSKISLDVKGMDIVDVLHMLARRAQLSIVIGRNVMGPVTLFLKNVDIADAFEIVLLANGLASEKKGDIVNIMTQQEYELKYGVTFQDQKQVRLVQLKYAKAADIAVALNQIKSHMGRIVVSEGSNVVAMIDIPGRITELEEFIKKTDLPVQTMVFDLNYAQADKLSPKIQEAITNGVGSLKIDERTNKIVVTDYPKKLEEIREIVKAFDEKTPQVLIDAQIVEINPNKDQFAMGVDWDYWLNKNMRFAGSLAAPSLTDVASIPNKLSFGVAAAASSTLTEKGQHRAVMDLLRVIGEAKIISSPRIMALNNQEARILVGTKEAYITSSTSQSGQTAVTSQTVNFVDVGIKLYVTPTINRDNFITIKIKPEISSAKRTDITSEGKVTQIPIVTTSESETTIMVKDGTTIIIAGLKKDKQEREVKKIPILGDIPLLGLVFSNIKKETMKTELVIFITPRIVSGEENIEYSSLTNDKDIAALQGKSKPKQEEKGPQVENTADKDNLLKRKLLIEKSLDK